MVTWITEKIITQTDIYIESTPKERRTDKGQFITPLEIANVMSNMLEIRKPSISILDPGAGSGVLTASLVHKVLNEGHVKIIRVDLYENDPSILDLLMKNIQTIAEECKSKGVEIIFNIHNGNFITENKSIWKLEHFDGEYDYVICNPPYMKLNKNSAETQTMDNIVHGQPNLYFLFMAMAVKLLKDNAQSVFIVPRSFFNGIYFKKFREWLLMNSSIEWIHHFESRERVFDGEILQETVILKVVKSEIKRIKITTSYDSNDISSSKLSLIGREVIVSKKNNTIRLPLSKKDSWTVSAVDSLGNTFLNSGIKFSTGPVVDFRNKEFISKDQSENSVPLIWSCNFTKNEIVWPSKNTKFHQYIKKHEKVLTCLLSKTDYVLIKRFTTKESKKPLKVNYYLKEKIEAEVFGIENHINYLKASDNINRDALFGIIILLSSQLYNDYFRIINGTTQINVSDLNALPCPTVSELKRIGRKYFSTIMEGQAVDESDLIKMLRIDDYQDENDKVNSFHDQDHYKILK